MTEIEFDMDFLKALIALYKEIEMEVQSLGTAVLKKNVGAILQRKNKIRSYIIDYAQSYLPDYTYANPMDLSEIEQIIFKSSKR